MKVKCDEDERKKRKQMLRKSSASGKNMFQWMNVFTDII